MISIYAFLRISSIFLHILIKWNVECYAADFKCVIVSLSFASSNTKQHSYSFSLKYTENFTVYNFPSIIPVIYSKSVLCRVLSRLLLYLQSCCSRERVLDFVRWFYFLFKGALWFWLILLMVLELSCISFFSLSGLFNSFWLFS